MINVRLNENIGTQMSAIIMGALVARYSFLKQYRIASNNLNGSMNKLDEFYHNQENFDMRFATSKEFFSGKSTIKPSQVRLHALKEFSKLDQRVTKNQTRIDSLNLRLYNKKKTHILREVGRKL